MDAPARERRRRELDEFKRLFDLEPDARAAALDRIARTDAGFAIELQRLLTDVDEEQAASIRADAADSRDRLAISERFRLIRLLGSGGMGEVHLAERTDDTAQRVAVKLVRSDLPIPAERARRERRILARLSHPHIAGLIDAGLTSRGQPWFAMDYVDGAAITDWCDEQGLDLPQRARLFAKVCRAVQFAHRNLVLHRDLKPSNILVDRDGVPKLLDFGIAKLLDATDTQQTQPFALTLAYASPEQLRGEAATTVSDVYQLGVVFHELACGTSVHAARIHATSSIDESLAPRMDQVFSALEARDPEAGARIARQRGTSVDRLRRALKGDLARIVAKASAQQPRERYDTAQALADDLERWADGLPVAAHAGSFGYRLGKLVRRHAVAASLVAVLALALVASSVVAVSHAARERTQREHADAQRAIADQQRQRADDERQRAQTLLGFMRSVFGEADPEKSRGEALDVVELLGRASTKLDARTDLDPVTRAAIKSQIADVFNGLFLAEPAIANASQALALLEPMREARAVDYLSTTLILLDALQLTDRNAEQIERVDKVLPVARATREGDREWEALLLKYRGSAQFRQGNFKAWRKDFADLFAIYDRVGKHDDPALAEPLAFQAMVLGDMGDANASLSAARRAEELALRSANPSVVSVATDRHNIAAAQYMQGRFAEALSTFEQLHATFPALTGADAPRTEAMLSRQIARCLAMLGDYPKARERMRGVIGRLEKDRDLDIRQVLSSELVAAKMALDLGRIREADRYLDSARSDIGRQSERPDFIALRLDWLRAEVMLHDGRCDEAKRLIDATRQRGQALLGDTPGWVMAELDDSAGRCAMQRGDAQAAMREFASAAARFRTSTGDGSVSALRSEIHALWSEAVSTGAAASWHAIEQRRAALVNALGNEDLLVIWQLDVLMDDLAQRSGRPPVEPSRIERARAGFTRLGYPSGNVHFAGLNSFG